MNDDQSSPDPRWGQRDRDKKAGAILRTLELALPAREVRRGTWLDVGCGSGGVIATLARDVEKAIGIDPEVWGRWAQFRKDHPNLELLQGSYRDLRTMVPEESIDVVVCNQVYEHVDDPGALLMEIHRVMKPDGVCYFAGPNLLWPIEPHVFWPFVHWLPRNFAIRLMTACNARYTDYLDAWSWPYWKLARAFRKTGFRYRGAIAERLRAQAGTGRSRLLNAAGYIPATLVSIFTPVAPGFIFILTKSAAAE